MRYSDDLRRKLIEAWESNRDTQQELADQFGVSLGWVEKVLRRWHDTGHSEALEFRPGPRPLLSPTRLEKLVLQHPDASLAELGGRLPVSGATVCRALQRMDLPRKKSRYTPASAIRRGSSGYVPVGAGGAWVWTRVRDIEVELRRHGAPPNSLRTGH
jgi:transposase